MGNFVRRVRGSVIEVCEPDRLGRVSLRSRGMAALRRTWSGRLAEEWRFVRNLIENPRTTGAIAPSGGVMARKMASVANPDSGLPVLEIGPGTGVMTRALLARGIAPERLWLVEFSADFVARLRADFPGVNVIHGDAFDLQATLGDHAGMVFDCVVSSLPLMSFPVHRRAALMESLLSRIPPGRPVVQFSYQPFPPAPSGRGDYRVEHFDYVLRNIPPARLWLYRRG